MKLILPKIALTYSGHSGELLTTWDDLIQLQGVLEKVSARHSLWRSRESCFSSSMVSSDQDETHWDAPLALNPADGIMRGNCMKHNLE